MAADETVRVEVLEGTGTVVGPLTLEVRDIIQASIMGKHGKDGRSVCTLVATRKVEDLTIQLDKVASEPPIFVPLFDRAVALESSDAFATPGRVWLLVAPRIWSGEEILKTLAAAEERPVSAWDGATTDLVTHLQWFSAPFFEQPTSVFVDALGPDEEAWGVPKPPGELRWEIGTTPETQRSGAPMLVVSHDESGRITGVRTVLAR